MEKKYNCKNSNILNEKVNRRAMIARGAVLTGAGLFGAAFNVKAEIPELQQKGNFFNVKDFGASGKRAEKATNPIRAAVEVCTSAGGGTVYVPPGDYTVGTIQMKDNVNLCLEAGATFFLSQDQADFMQGALSMIYAKDANNFAVTGRGTLNGLAQYEFVDMQGIDVEIVEEIELARAAGIDMRRYYRTGMQTFIFVLNDCKNVMLEDISIINSPLWTIRLNNCDCVKIHGIYLYSDLEKGVNADGIDICSSRNVTISDSIIITGDDSIVLKTPKETEQEGPVNVTENIVVTNCILSSSSTPLMIGTETFADIRHVLFNNCVIRNSNKGFGINV
jgi:polygalacturonase